MQVDLVTPRRGRGTDTYRIDGLGFSGTPGQNDVIVSGSSGSITAESATQIDFTLPFLFSFGIIRDVHVRCQIVNLDNGESAYFWIRLKANVDEVADYVIESAIPGPFEQQEEERPRYFEALDMERLAAMLEAWTRDVTAGQILARDAGGVAEPGGSPAQGGVLKVDLAEATDLRWAAEQDVLLPFGGACAGANVLLAADGQRSAAPGGETEGWPPYAGTIVLAWLLVKEPGGNTLDQVRILVNGTPAATFGPGLGIANNGVWSAAPAIAVAAGDVVELEASRLGAGTVELIGGLKIVQA